MKILKINVNSLLFGIICLLGFWLSACEDDYVAESVPDGQKSPLQSIDLNEAVQGVVKVKFKRGAEPFLAKTRVSSPFTGMEQVDAVTRSLGDVKMRRVFSDDPRFRERHRKYDLDLWYEVQFDENTDLGGIVAGYTKSGWVDIVQPVYRITPTGAMKGDVVTKVDAGLQYLFNDPLLKNQWHYGLGEMSIGEKGNIGLYKAWEVTAGSPDVIVAIVDMGVDVNHEDLAANMWVNTNEVPGNGIDDDGNGMVDDVNGYNFVDRKGVIVAGEHGTHVAGTVGAINNNERGVCGVAGGSGKGDGVRLMSCQMMSESSSGGSADAIRYAADNGAVICQCSWGIGPTIDYADLAAIDYFTDNAGCDKEGKQVGPMKGGVAIFAMGNDGMYGKVYPASYEKCIAVAAIDIRNKMAKYSNYHESVDIVAPGGDDDAALTRYVWSTFPKNKYGQMKGTSMACPHVSGVAALVVSKMKGLGFTREKLVNNLYASCQSLAKDDSKNVAYMGHGLIRADYALLGRSEQVELAVINDLRLQNEGGEYSLLWTVRQGEKGDLPVGFNVYYSEQELNADNYLEATVSHFTPDTIFAGMAVRYVLPQLETPDNMYFVVTGIDPWGRESGISSLSESTGDYELKVYPNPVRTDLNLSWGGSFKGEKTLTIYDMASRRVMQKVIEEGQGTGRDVWDVSKLAAGKYLLEFKSDDSRKTVSILKI